MLMQRSGFDIRHNENGEDVVLRLPRFIVCVILSFDGVLWKRNNATAQIGIINVFQNHQLLRNHADSSTWKILHDCRHADNKFLLTTLKRQHRFTFRSAMQIL